MKTFDFSVLPTLSLADEGATLVDWPVGEREVQVELRNGDLFMQGKRIVPYLPAKQVAYENDIDLQESLSLLTGLPLVHPMLMQVLHDHPELIPRSFDSFLDVDGNNWGKGGFIFPLASVLTWTKKKAHPCLFTMNGIPHFSYSILDRLPRSKSYLIEIG